MYVIITSNASIRDRIGKTKIIPFLRSKVRSHCLGHLERTIPYLMANTDT